jgi:hypothetical protein
MPRGGKRQGTPGKGYSNRTDLIQNYDQQAGSPAAGGMTPPPPPMQTPDDSPNLTDPTQFPDEPITTGLRNGPGAGPTRDTRKEETQQLARFLPLIGLYLDNPDTPDSVRSLFRYIKGA